MRRRWLLILGWLCIPVALWSCLAKQVQPFSPAPPAFRFLLGHTPARTAAPWSRGFVAVFNYSFQADFDKVLSEAETELSQLGFRKQASSAYAAFLKDIPLTADKNTRDVVTIKKNFRNGQVRQGWVYVTVLLQSRDAAAYGL